MLKSGWLSLVFRAFPLLVPHGPALKLEPRAPLLQTKTCTHLYIEWSRMFLCLESSGEPVQRPVLVQRQVLVQRVSFSNRHPSDSDGAGPIRVARA